MLTKADVNLVVARRTISLNLVYANKNLEPKFVLRTENPQA